MPQLSVSLPSSIVWFLECKSHTQPMASLPRGSADFEGAISAAGGVLSRGERNQAAPTVLGAGVQPPTPSEHPKGRRKPTMSRLARWLFGVPAVAVAALAWGTAPALAQRNGNNHGGSGHAGGSAGHVSGATRPGGFSRGAPALPGGRAPPRP